MVRSDRDGAQPARRRVSVVGSSRHGENPPLLPSPAKVDSREWRTVGHGRCGGSRVAANWCHAGRWPVGLCWLLEKTSFRYWPLEKANLGIGLVFRSLLLEIV